MHVDLDIANSQRYGILCSVDLDHSGVAGDIKHSGVADKQSEFFAQRVQDGRDPLHIDDILASGSDGDGVRDVVEVSDRVQIDCHHRFVDVGRDAGGVADIEGLGVVAGVVADPVVEVAGAARQGGVGGVAVGWEMGEQVRPQRI